MVCLNISNISFNYEIYFLALWELKKYITNILEGLIIFRFETNLYLIL